MTVYITKDEYEQLFTNVVEVSGNEGHLQICCADGTRKIFDMYDIGYFEIK